jgi:hypothetical protein
MKRMLSAAVAVTTIGFAAVFAQSGKSPLEGAWELQNATYPKPPNNPVTKPRGMVILSGNRYSLIVVNDSERPTLRQDDVVKATADQLRAVWGPLTAHAGTFQIAGNMITMRPAVVKNNPPNASSFFFEHTFTLKGDSLTMTESGFPGGPPSNPRTLHLIRAK